MSLKMTPSDIASAVLEVASLKTHVHRVTVAGVRGVFGQHYYNWGQSTTSQSHRHFSRGQHWLGLGDWVCCFQHRCRLFILGDRVWSQMRKKRTPEVTAVWHDTLKGHGWRTLDSFYRWRRCTGMSKTAVTAARQSFRNVRQQETFWVVVGSWEKHILCFSFLFRSLEH